MAPTTKCGHCGARQTQVAGNHTHCFECDKWTDSEGKPVDHAYA